MPKQGWRRGSDPYVVAAAADNNDLLLQSDDDDVMHSRVECDGDQGDIEGFEVLLALQFDFDALLERYGRKHSHPGECVLNFLAPHPGGVCLHHEGYARIHGLPVLLGVKTANALPAVGIEKDGCRPLLRRAMFDVHRVSVQNVADLLEHCYDCRIPPVEILEIPCCSTRHGVGGVNGAADSLSVYVCCCCVLPEGCGSMRRVHLEEQKEELLHCGVNGGYCSLEVGYYHGEVLVTAYHREVSDYLSGPSKESMLDDKNVHIVHASYLGSRTRSMIPILASIFTRQILRL